MSYHWDDAENEYLTRRVKEGAKASVIADEMGKTYRAVKARMNRAGLTRQSSLKGRWEREDDRLLIDLRKDGTGIKRLAILLGRSEHAIKTRLQHLGLAQNDKGSPGKPKGSHRARAVVDLVIVDPPRMTESPCPWEMWRRAMTSVARRSV